MGGKRKSRKQLTPLELQIMTVLWDLGPSSVHLVQQKLSGSHRLAYTTVQTMLNVLHRKGRVKRTLRGRAFEYQPLITRDRAARNAIHDMIDRLFGGSVEHLLMNLIKSKRLHRDKLEKLGELIDAHQLREKEGRHGND